MIEGTVEWNRGVWDGTYDWSDAGEEWSDWWGDSESMWHAAVVPRIEALVPTGTVLEIAPGFGRWTRFLLPLCERLVAVDLSTRCIDHCRRRFAGVDHLELHVNDGSSLAMVDDGTVDLAFSLDSLVHADPTVIERYLDQLAAKLSPDGVGFFHHSNLGAYTARTALFDRLPAGLGRLGAERGWLPNPRACRDGTMTVERFAELCDRVGLACIEQETVSWSSGRMMTDGFSVFTRKGSRWERPNRRTATPDFHQEAERARRRWAAANR